ncbi:MAG: DinB family protein [Phycisphaerales bacterium]
MGQFSQIFVDAGTPFIAYAERVLDGVGPHNCARKPTWGIGGELIDCNHPSFVFGHLALYPARMYTMLGLDPAPVAAPNGFEDLFAAGKECRDDPHGSIYPELGLITSAFFRGMRATLDTVARTSDAEFLKNNPVEKARARFPTVGSAVNFMLTGHVGVHIGQLSTWRRAMGLPPAIR